MRTPAVAIVILFAIFALDASIAQARLYKWVDKNGVVHYSDQLPAQDSKLGHSVLSNSGMTVDKVAPAKTPEQIQEEKRKAAIEALKRKQREAQDHRDHTLLMTYTSVRDIENARDDKLSTIASSVKQSEARKHSLQAELSTLEQQAANAEVSGHNSPTEFYKRIGTLQNSIRQEKAYIKAMKQQAARIRTSYSADIARFKELMAKQAQSNTHQTEAQ